jgi:hypothetical protein
MSKVLWRALAIAVAISSLVVVLLVIILDASDGARAPVFTNSARGYRLTYPDGWNPTLIFNGTLTLRSFPPEATLPGGIPPKGGMLVAVQAFPPYTNPVFREGMDDDTALDKLIEAGAGTITSRVAAVSGKPARVAYSESLINLQFVATIRHQEGRTFLFTLVYRTDDPNGAAHERTLDDVIASVSVIDGAPPSPRP